MKSKKILLIAILLFSMQFASAAHFIIGEINNAFDGTDANGFEVVLWRSETGRLDNITDIIGPAGNSGTSNYYMVDCEMLGTPCSIGDIVNVSVINNGSNYITNYTNLTVTGAGFDVMSSLRLNSLPLVTSTRVEDDILFPQKEIDLIPASTKRINCEGILYDFDGDSTITNVSAAFFDASNAGFASSDDNNNHYTNSSCFVNKSYGTGNEAYANCTFNVWYYANSANWNCTLKAFDDFSTQNNKTNNTYVNSLLAINVDSPLDYGELPTFVSPEFPVNITNYGNVKINLTLSGYAISENDNLSMNCSAGTNKNISIGYEKFNLTSSNTSNLSLSQFEAVYTNLTSNSQTKRFSLDFRQDDATNEAINATYWRIYLPIGAAGTCSGKIVFAATQSPGS